MLVAMIRTSLLGLAAVLREVGPLGPPFLKAQMLRDDSQNLQRTEAKVTLR